MKKIIWGTAVMDARSATSGMGIAEVREKAPHIKSLGGSITRKNNIFIGRNDNDKRRAYKGYDE